MTGEIYVRAWQRAFVDILPQSHLDSMDVGAEASAWEPLLRPSRWPAAGALLAEDDHAAVAFAVFSAADIPGSAELATLYALPEVWGAGVGRRLLAATTQAMRRADYRNASLWVLAANRRARRFYEAAGWHWDGTVVDDPSAGLALPKLRYRCSLS
ncbi:GNAT family N-acetyltransferase [Actinomadura graeca]|uniref:GNAT family N-acetyltransferase n=1 Tax=Actinomadura graeca TaxID=2750812 RepID=UPI001E50B5B7|nr:GNAT family N-acetyltransferase [Actinomadura graeca]